jgi:uncharacterized membrane protein YdjX (TVP38/TMEM64 family)
MDRPTLGWLLMLLTVVGLVGYLLTAEPTALAERDRRRVQGATALAVLALLLSLSIIRGASPGPSLVAAVAGAVVAWFWVGAFWRRRGR